MVTHSDDSLTRIGSISFPTSEPNFLKNHELYIALVFLQKKEIPGRKYKLSILCHNTSTSINLHTVTLSKQKDVH